MNPEIPRALEAILLVADSPVESELLAGIVELSIDEVDAVLTGLAAGYAAEERGFTLVRVAGGWRYQTHPGLAAYVERFVLDGQSAKLSAAALETLAIIAYKQPISRAQIATIRGVGVDGVVRTLEQRGYIGEVARDAGPGQAVLFGTTPSFLEKMGLDSLAQLPSIAEFVPGADVVEALEHGLRFDLADPGIIEDDVVVEDAIVVVEDAIVVVEDAIVVVEDVIVVVDVVEDPDQDPDHRAEPDVTEQVAPAPDLTWSAPQPDEEGPG